jgi:LSD1 subclass zinc finger protein
MRECNSCGSPLEGDPLARSWTCAYCKTVNHNEGFLRQHIDKIDFTKAHNLLQVGLAAYGGGDYKKAAHVLERVLLEDATNIDAWVYSALATAYMADMSNYEDFAKKVDSYLRKAVGVDSASDVLAICKSVCANTLGKVALRIVERQYEDAKKAWFSYESTDKDRANRQTNAELEAGLRYADHALSLKPDDLKVIGRIAVLTILSDRLYKGNNPQKAIVAKARVVLSTVKEKNPSLYAEYAKDLDPPKQKSEKSGCAGQASTLIAALAVSGISVVAIIVFLISL